MKGTKKNNKKNRKGRRISQGGNDLPNIIKISLPNGKHENHDLVIKLKWKKRVSQKALAAFASLGLTIVTLAYKLYQSIKKFL